jgi:hypothetical protein
VKTSVTTSRRRLRKASVPHTSTSRAASKPAMYSSYLMREAIGGHQRSSEVIGGHPRQEGVVPGERALDLPRAKRVQRILGVFVPVPVLIPIRNRRLDGEPFPAGQAERRRHARGEHEGCACMQRFVPDEGGNRRSSEVIGGTRGVCLHATPRTCYGARACRHVARRRTATTRAISSRSRRRTGRPCGCSTRASPLCATRSGVISGHQRSSAVISGHQCATR